MGALLLLLLGALLLLLELWGAVSLLLVGLFDFGFSWLSPSNRSANGCAAAAALGCTLTGALGRHQYSLGAGGVNIPLPPLLNNSDI